MPTDPSYTSTASVSRPSKIFSTEYETYDEVFSTPTHNSVAPCVVCHVPTLLKRACCTNTISVKPTLTCKCYNGTSDALSTQRFCSDFS